MADPGVPAAVQRADPAEGRGRTDPVPHAAQPATRRGQAVVSEVLSPVVSRFEGGATLTPASANAALAAGLQRIAAGATGVDCAPLAQFDSSALAVLIAWQRAAQAAGAGVEIVTLPAGLASLPHVYGVDTIISARH